MNAVKSPATAAARLMSVDAVRGFDMFWICGGGELVRRVIELFAHPMPQALAKQFGHVEWQGFAAWDLIMPLFLFIVGTSLPLSLTKRLARGERKKTLYLHAIRRFFILFVLGMIAQGHLLSFDPSKFHFYSNTLQAIACGYIVATVLIINVSIVWQAVATVALLLLYWALMTFVPFAGHAAGVLEPHANLALYVDETILGRFRDGTTYTWILSSITFAATVMLGVLSGHLLQSKLSSSIKVACLFGAAAAGLGLGLLWDIWFPIIKHIWTSSFVLYAAGWSFLLLAVFYWIIDVLEYRKWAFMFVVIGMNAIVAYMAAAEMFSAGFVADLLTHGAAKTIAPAAMCALAAVVFGLVWLALYGMYKKKIFIKI